MVAVFSGLENFITQFVGSMWLGVLILLAFCLFLVLWRGLDFRYALILFTPAIVRFASVGWILTWIGGVIYIITIGFGMYLLWSAVSNR